MRVGLDATILAPDTRHSGIGTYTISLLNNLAQAETSNEYVAYGPPGGARPADLHLAVRWRALPDVRLGKLRALATSMWVLPRVARGDRLDLFHAPTVHPRPSLPAVPRRMPCPIAVTVHDLIPLTFYHQGPDRLPLRWRAFYRWNLRAAASAELVIAVSEAARRELTTALGSIGNRARVIHNGVDVAPPAIAKPPGTRPYVLFAGSFEARKNLARFVRAYSRAVTGGLSYDLVVMANPGSGDRLAVDYEIARAGLADRVRFTHGVTDAELWDLYGNAAVVAFPSLAEGFGLPPLEAMAAGTPVIASRLPALEEVLGDAAAFVDPYSEASMAEAMLSLEANVSLRDDLAHAGRRRARLYSWRHCADQTLTAYQEICAGRLPADAETRRRARPEAA